MKPANIGLTKLHMQFTNDRGEEVNYDYVEIEIAPNLYTKINLTPSNCRVIQKYNPDFWQMISNSPIGNEIVFTENRPKHLDGIYSLDTNNEL